MMSYTPYRPFSVTYYDSYLCSDDPVEIQQWLKCPQQVHDPCTPGPCQNGGTCQADGSTFSCNCPPGFQGITCERVAGPCDSKPCKRGGKCQPNMDDGTYRCDYYQSCHAIIRAGVSEVSANYFIQPACSLSSVSFKVYCDQTNDDGGWMKLYTTGTTYCGTSFVWTKGKIMCQEKDLIGLKISSDYHGKYSRWALHDGMCSSLTIANVDFFMDVINCQKPSYPTWSWGGEGVLVEGVCSTDASWGSVPNDVCGNSANVSVNISVRFDSSTDSYGTYVMSCLNATDGNWIIIDEWAADTNENTKSRNMWIKIDTTGPCVSNPCPAEHTCRHVLNGTTVTFTCDSPDPCHPNPCDRGGVCQLTEAKKSGYDCEFHEASCQAIIDAGMSTGYAYYKIRPVCGPVTSHIGVNCDPGNNGGGWMRLYGRKTTDEGLTQCVPPYFSWTKGKMICQETDIKGIALSRYGDGTGTRWALHDGSCTSLNITNLDFFVDLVNCKTPIHTTWSWGHERVLVEGVCSTDASWGDVSNNACGNSTDVPVNISVHFGSSDGKYSLFVLSCINASSGNWIAIGKWDDQVYMWAKINITSPCLSTPCPAEHTCRPMLNGTMDSFTCEPYGICEPNPCRRGGTCQVDGNGTAGTYSCHYHATCQEIAAAGPTGNSHYSIIPACDEDKQPVYIYCDQTNNGGGWMRLSNIEAGDCSSFAGTNKLFGCRGTELDGFALSKYSSVSGKRWLLQKGTCSSLNLSYLDFFVDIATCKSPADSGWHWDRLKGTLVKGVCSTDARWGSDVSNDVCGNSVSVPVKISVRFDSSTDNYGTFVMSCLNGTDGNWIIVDEWALSALSEYRNMWVKI